MLGRDRGDDSPAAAAGAVQGQGHQVRGRGDAPQGRQGRRRGGSKLMHGTSAETHVARMRRQARVRRRVHGTDARPRLCVFRSGKHIYVQVISDQTGRTLAAASTLSPDVEGRAEDDRQPRSRQAGRHADRPALSGARHPRRRVRSQRLSLSRPRQGAWRTARAKRACSSEDRKRMTAWRLAEAESASSPTASS